MSFIQRGFRIGYTAGATIVNRLEKEGIIGPYKSNLHPRDVLGLTIHAHQLKNFHYPQIHKNVILV